MEGPLFSFMPMADIDLHERSYIVARAFYRQFDNYNRGIEFYVYNVYSETLVAWASHEEVFYRAGYTLNEDTREVTFQDPAEWIKVHQEWVPNDAQRALFQTQKRDLLAEAEPTPAAGQVSQRRANEAPAVHISDPFEPRRGQLYFRDFGSWDLPAPQIRQIDDGKRLQVTINTSQVDRHRTIILPTGMDVQTYNDANPVVLINHDHNLPVATSRVGIRGTGFDARMQATLDREAWDMDDPEAVRWFNKIFRDEPIVRSASVGVIFHEVVPGRDFSQIEELLGRTITPTERLPYIITKSELLEWSFVSVPSNPGATVDEVRSMISKYESRLASAIEQMQARLTLAAIPSDQPARVVVPVTSAPAAEPSAPAPSPVAVETLSAIPVPTQSPATQEDYAQALRFVLPAIAQAVDHAIDKRTGRKAH